MMPRGNKTGPEGQGPRTGRGLGYCSGSEVPGYENNEQEFGGQGMGRGQGRAQEAGRGGRRNAQGRGRGLKQGMGRGRNQSFGIAPEMESGFQEPPVVREENTASLTARLETLQSEMSKLIKHVQRLEQGQEIKAPGKES
jgi:Family of unknown function (DUF5320)